LTLPAGILYVVATPIGNLADASSRALEALREADLIACEDTRTSRTLLAHHGIDVPVVALHQHNEKTQAKKLIETILKGKDVALISDAGTPGVSDPGALLVEAAHRHGARVVPLPGPSAAIAAWSASGFASPGFHFIGFFNEKAVQGPDSARPIILYEAPHRIRETVRSLLERFGPEREVVIARELTKVFEEIARMPLGEAPAWLEGAHRQQGEFVLVLGPGAPKSPGLAEGERVMEILLGKMTPSDAARLAARITGAARKDLYAAAVRKTKEK
jgi:16S rRNA (cytidine1402-2'-O)-methyltransferase